MSMLADQVDVVIGVDTHKASHTAAVVEPTGGVVAHLTVPIGCPRREARPRLRPAAAARPPGVGHRGHRQLRLPGSRPTCSSRASGSSRSTGRHGRLAATAPSPTSSTPRVPPARRCRASTWPSRADVVSGRHCASCSRPGREPSCRGRGPSPRSTPWWSTRPRGSATSCATSTTRRPAGTLCATPDRIRRSRPSIAPRSSRCAATARRALACEAEAADLESALELLVEQERPELLAEPGVGAITAAAILNAWSHAGRIRSEAAFAMLAGVAPLPASSGQTVRHRLNRAGDRQLNRALHTIVLSRLTHDPETTGLCQATSGRRQDTARDQALPEAPPGPAALRAPRAGGDRGLTDIEASCPCHIPIARPGPWGPTGFDDRPLGPIQLHVASRQACR